MLVDRKVKMEKPREWHNLGRGAGAAAKGEIQLKLHKERRRETRAWEASRL